MNEDVLRSLAATDVAASGSQRIRLAEDTRCHVTPRP